MKKWMSSLPVLVLLLTLLLSACTQVPTAAPVSAAAEVPTSQVTAEGTLKPASQVELSFVQAGITGEVLVQPGSQVAHGDVLARLVGIETAQAELAAAQMEQTLAQQALDSTRRNAMLTGADAHKSLQSAQKAYENEARGWSLTNQDDATDLELALDKYIEAETDYRAAKTELDQHADKDQDNPKRQSAQRTLDDEKKNLAQQYAGLMEEIPAADERLNEKQTALLKAISTLEIARQQVERLEKGIDQEQLTALETRLKAAEAHLAAAQATLSFYELRAPFAGTVLSMKDLSSGKAAIPGQPVLFLANTSRWVVETKDLAEIDIARIAIGQTVAVQLDAFEEEVFSGKVTAIDPVGREYLSDMTYQITVTLDETDPRFLWNMTATVTVDAE